MVGRTISHYRILDKLGEGGMGVVYKAEDTKLHRAVALKFVRPDAVENSELKARFLNEAVAAAALIHPNICVVHEIDEVDGQSFIAMEYVEGDSLADKIKKRPLSLDDALGIAAQVAEGLRAAHAKVIVHRDVKPANVMIDAAGRVKITDFGLAHLEKATKITKAGTLLGTPAYMSPEQVRGERVDHRSDIWSLGVVIYEMISGRLPFEGDAEQGVIYAILHEEPEPLTALRSRVPIELDRVLDKALAKNAEDRYQHIEDLIVDLRAARRQVEFAGSTPHTSGAKTASPSSSVSVGHMLGHYRLQEKLGEGGMGAVYRAHDTHLERSVAIKVLSPSLVADISAKKRFIQEARAASALNHPNIVTVYDINEAGGVDYMAMEYVDGETLDQTIGEAGLALDEALGHAALIASALSKAHTAGIVHRDLKPANIMVTADGYVKILDFGLAKLTEPAGGDDVPVTRLRTEEAVTTREGAVLGTVAYMSPEQAEGKHVDARTDIFSFGVVFYEMLTGRRPFRGESKLSTLMAILRDPPPSLQETRKDVPADVETVLLKCLEKDPALRYPSGQQLRKAVVECRQVSQFTGATEKPVSRRPWYAIPAAMLALVAVIAGTWSLWRYSRIQWARNEAIPEIHRLVETEDLWSAYRLAQRVANYIPDDPEVLRVTRDSVVATSINTSPPGAEIYVKSYAAPDSDWNLLGVSPLQNIPMVATLLRWKITREGFEDVRAGFDVLFTPEVEIPLTPENSGPAGMVFVPRGTRGSGRSRELDDYWIDRQEVTNRQYKEFVDGGGYLERKYWKHPIVKDGHEIGWAKAMGEFVDRTGRSGPSSWELGAYPDGQAEHPVSGVSWYEAAAYADFAGKSLPTIYHWEKAAGYGLYSDQLIYSNLDGKGPIEVGSRPNIGPYGTYDMAGNLKEWCWNEVGERRYTRGASWNEPSYLFMHPDAHLPYERRENQGFRCVKYISPPSPELTRAVERRPEPRSPQDLEPVDDEHFELLKRFYSYDPTDLNATVDAVDDGSPHWRKETITFDAAYGAERVIAYLFLPKNVAPPYQVVMICPSGASQLKGRTLMPGPGYWSFFVRTGRAVMYPVWKGAFARRVTSDTSSPNVQRDLFTAKAKDLGRSLDYLETRQDIDQEKIGYWGISATSFNWPILGAIEKRIQAAVLWVGGLDPMRGLPEVDPFNFAPRSTAPVLVMNGRVDFMVSVESGRRLYDALGAPDEHKELFLFEGGHIPLQREEVIGKTLDWFDQYLGPVVQ